MSADLQHRPARRRRPRSPEIQITRQVIGGREVITIDDSDDEVQPAPQAVARGPRRAHTADVAPDGRARFEEMRRRQQAGEAFGYRDRMQAAIDGGDLEFAIIPDDEEEGEDEDDADYDPDDNHIFSPTPPPARGTPNRRRIALGGALLLQDGRQINLHLGERVRQYLFGANHDLFAQAAPPAIPAYKTEFTHPTPRQGFTPSFPAAPLSPDRKGKSVNPPASINFQCTNCNDNLYLGAPDVKRRVYALRCGHLLDGQCVAKLSTPPRGIFPQTETIPVLDAEPPTRRGRGRGSRAPAKAKPRGRKRKRGEEEKLTWDWVCPGCQHAHVSLWDASAGEGQRGAWIPHPEEGAILLYL